MFVNLQKFVCLFLRLQLENHWTDFDVTFHNQQLIQIFDYKKLFLWSILHLRQNRENYYYFFFLHSGNFPLKFDGVKLLGLECSIKPQDIMKIVKVRSRKNYLNIIQFQGFFREKPIVSHVWVSNIGTINPQNLIKIVGAIFEKIKIFNFFRM